MLLTIRVSIARLKTVEPLKAPGDCFGCQGFFRLESAAKIAVHTRSPKTPAEL